MLKKLSVIALTSLALATSATSFAKDSLLERINKVLTPHLPITMKVAN